jgi:hypothetical protein
MKSIHLLLFILMVEFTGAAANVGLYDISDASHPRPLTNQISQVTVHSISNNNRSYHLEIKLTNSLPVKYLKIALIAGEKTIRFWGGNEDNTFIETTVDDPEAVLLIAEHFHANVVKRQHPGQQMLVEFIPDKRPFKIGEPVVVRLRITNVGNHDFTFVEGGRQRGPRDNQFAFSAEVMGGKIAAGRMMGAMLPDIGDPMNFGGIAGSVTLKPGQSREIPVDLNNWFKFERNGEYSIRGSYYMELIDPDKSNFQTIWEDYACAEFTIRMGN